MAGNTYLQGIAPRLLKSDMFSRTELVRTDDAALIRRDARDAPFAVRWLAYRLLAREAAILAVLDDLAGVPQLARLERGMLERTFIDGQPMQEGRPADVGYFNAAARLLRQMHRRCVVHNDLAKEPNLLLTTQGTPAIIDFQLASFMPKRGRLFRLLAREDVRHLLKHKRTYCPGQLTRREKSILDNPSWIARLWQMCGKPVYLFITRRLLHWKDREGAGDRV